MKEVNNELIAFPDSPCWDRFPYHDDKWAWCSGMGCGGDEAEAVMLGQPYGMPVPDVVGFKLYGELKEGITATDLVLTITQIFRRSRVVGEVVQFFGPGSEL